MWSPRPPLASSSAAVATAQNPSAAAPSPPRARRVREEGEVSSGADDDEASGIAALDVTKKKKKKKNKNKNKKRKAIDDAAAPEPESVNVTKNKKKNKKRKAIDAASTAAPKPETMNVTISAPTPAPAPTLAPDLEPEPINVTVDASLTGGSAAAAAPVVAYFPSGYDPLAQKEPSTARLFRNVKHPSRIDLVVRSPGGGPDFVGKSYAGEAGLPQLCNYALGVLDKASGTLKVVPIACDKILRLEPYLEVQKPALSQNSGVASEAGSAVATGGKKVQELTGMYGSKKDKEKDKKWRSLIEQGNDPSAYEDLHFGEPNTNANASDTSAVDNQSPAVIHNIPPYDLTADTSEKAYLFDEIIPKNIRSHLLEILGHLESGEFSSKGYGSFVSNRVHKLEKLEGEDKERLAWILSYITHLLTLLARNSSISKRHRKETQANVAPAVPQAVYSKLLIMFTEGSTTLSTEKKELLINYILVLTLFADDFRSDPADICADLKMTRQMVKPYYDQLGCKVVSAGAFQPSFMTLPAPLKFPKEITKKRRRR